MTNGWDDFAYKLSVLLKLLSLPSNLHYDFTIFFYTNYHNTGVDTQHVRRTRVVSINEIVTKN